MGHGPCHPLRLPGRYNAMTSTSNAVISSSPSAGPIPGGGRGTEMSSALTQRGLPHIAASCASSVHKVHHSAWSAGLVRTPESTCKPSENAACIAVVRCSEADSFPLGPSECRARKAWIRICVSRDFSSPVWSRARILVYVSCARLRAGIFLGRCTVAEGCLEVIRKIECRRVMEALFATYAGIKVSTSRMGRRG
jgi:hypothetical protein